MTASTWGIPFCPRDRRLEDNSQGVSAQGGTFAAWASIITFQCLSHAPSAPAEAKAVSKASAIAWTSPLGLLSTAGDLPDQGQES